METNLLLRKSLPTEGTTFLRKGFNGWVAETIIKSINGYDWKINTSKSGKEITSIAQSGEAGHSDTHQIWKCSIFTDPSVALIRSTTKCTEKQVRELHIQALLKFEEIIESNQLPGKTKPEYQLTIGQIVHGSNTSSKYAISKITETSLHFKSYELIELDTKAIIQADRIDHRNDLVGIGFYYNENERISEDELNNLIISAKQREADLSQLQAINDAAIREHREQMIQLGKPLVNIPDGTVAILVAILKKDESDSMTDYFNHRTEKKVYLQFSDNIRDSFKEMRAAAARFESTKHLANCPAEFEHREKYSMGSGYYLSEYRHSGWEIRKQRFSSTEMELNNLYIAAAENCYFCNEPSPTEAIPSNQYSIAETIHSVKKHPLFVIKMTKRVSKATFMELRKIALRHSGYYSSYDKEGAIPGFQFKTRENAQKALISFTQL